MCACRFAQLRLCLTFEIRHDKFQTGLLERRNGTQHLDPYASGMSFYRQRSAKQGTGTTCSLLVTRHGEIEDADPRALLLVKRLLQIGHWGINLENNAEART